MTPCSDLYTYDARASVVAQLAMPTGQTIAYARDAQGRLLSTTLSGTARQTLATHAYTYDLAGQRTTASTASATTAYTYDALRQLATATETPAGTGQTPSQQFAYAYDPIGNRLTAATAAETTTYTANSVNQYTAIVPGTGLPFTPTYDANGNTTTLPSGLVLDYDEENRLVSAATLTAREEYTYDGLGRRVERRTFTAASGLTAPATTTRYVYDGWRVLEELTSSHSSPFTLHSSYTRGLDLSGTLEGAGGIGGLLAMTRDPAGSATSAYYFHDGNGNVSTLVSASDALVASYTYTPFGDTLTATGTWASVNAYRFSAKECDAFTGLYYYGFRYYNPSTGKWISRDLIGENGGANLYGFVCNDAILKIDAIGLVPWRVTGGKIVETTEPNPNNSRADGWTSASVELRSEGNEYVAIMDIPSFVLVYTDAEIANMGFIPSDFTTAVERAKEAESQHIDDFLLWKTEVGEVLVDEYIKRCGCLTPERTAILQRALNSSLSKAQRETAQFWDIPYAGRKKPFHYQDLDGWKEKKRPTPSELDQHERDIKNIAAQLLGSIPCE